MLVSPWSKRTWWRRRRAGLAIVGFCARPHCAEPAPDAWNASAGFSYADTIAPGTRRVATPAARAAPILALPLTHPSMSPDPITEPPFAVVETVARGGTTFELLEYRPLAGSEPVAAVERLYALNRAGARLRQLRVRLSDDAVRTEPGALQFLRGHIKMESTTGAGAGLGGLMRGALAAARTGETVFKPLYRGRGELYLEPTFGHVWLAQLGGGAPGGGGEVLGANTVYADQGLFYCSEDSVQVSAHKVESFSARMAGGEGRYQTELTGSGVVAFRIPVPRSEIITVDLADETLQVDGSFALLRTGDVRFTVERAGGSLADAVTSGEGLLQTFRGTGRVWLAPTQPLYARMLAPVTAAGG